MQSKHSVSKIVLRFIQLLFCLFTAVTYSQTSEGIADAIAEKVQVLTRNQNLDNVYLQTSKGIYETKEDLWFKGYVLDAQSLIPSNRSKILFVQLIEDESDKVVWEEKYEIENGFVDGHLYLNDSLKSGSYTLAAYSATSFYKGIKNFNALRKLQILKNIDDNTKVVIPTAKKEDIASFEVFTEGGNMVSGIQNRIAFKALNAKGLPVTITGKLYENDIPILDFKSTHAGMGSLIFKPNSNHKYHIELTDYKNVKHQLPQIHPQGTVLQLVSNDNDFATFKVVKTKSINKENIYLRLQSRGIVYSIAMGVLDEKLTVKIPLKDVPQGIAEVTLFNGNIEPIAERLIYVNQQKKLNVLAIVDKSDYQIREKVSLKIKVTDQKNQPVVAHLGLGVFDQLYQNKLDSKNILTHYYLSTALNGTIYDPGYYFNEKNTDRHQALDLLLLTQGWRRYVWNEHNLTERNAHFQTFLSDSIVGLLGLENPNKKTVELTSKVVMVFTADPLKEKDIFTTDSNGVFSINSTHLKIGERGYLYLKPMAAEKPKHVINIKDNPFANINSARKEVTINYPLSKLQDKAVDNMRETWMRLNDIQKLDEVVITSNKKKVFRDKYLGTLDSLARLDSGNMDFVCLAGGPKRPILNCFMRNHHDGNTRTPKDGEMVVVLLGKNKEILGTDYPQQAYYGTREIIYKDSNQNLTEAELLRKFNLKMMKGYYGKREFYQAVYDEVTITDPLPDYRNTLFWKPNIITDTNGEASVDFYCSDINTNFTGIIEGVSGEGLLGFDNFEFRVKKDR
ncbi:hypothetical protein AAGV28_07850 [Flavobacterium sp. FZUC8N2.13]|uniref:MG2 domain-containing protein n=1 Tax=Flavobacterium zubiriense TaxID=3138075 RepID=A0ABV4TBB3_9FLAO